MGNSGIVSEHQPCKDSVLRIPHSVTDSVLGIALAPLLRAWRDLLPQLQTNSQALERLSGLGLIIKHALTVQFCKAVKMSKTQKHKSMF